MFRDIPAVFLSLPDAFCQEIFDLPVDRAEIILRPRGDGVIKLIAQPQRNLFLRQKSTSFRSVQAS